MATYVDGFVVPVPKKNLTAYRALARKAARVWREHGAISYQECAAEDMEARGMTAFPALIAAKPTETVVLAWITYRSRAHRDRVTRKVMADPRLAAMCDPAAPLFDFRRMAYGGFTTIVAR
jgi:uncharacterized protein YbaA (DUF1428 family)